MNGERVLDVAAVGAGPFNLSLAALADGVEGLEVGVFERGAAFSWHPGLLIEGASLQVPFLADLVSLVDPTSRWSFLAFLAERERLFPFYFQERFHIERAEYDAYCRWVARGLGTVRFGHQVEAVRWNAGRALFELDFAQLDPVSGEVEALGRVYARHVCLGIGTAPYVPEPLRVLEAGAGVPVWHSADYLAHREELLAADRVVVVGSGQSGAEVFLDLLRRRPLGREGLRWFSRSGAFAPMEYSKLGLEQFTPDHTRWFHGLSEQVRDELLPSQWQLYKAVDAGTLAEVHDELYRRKAALDALDEAGAGGGWPDVVLTPGVRVRTAGRLGATRLELHVEHVRQGVRSREVADAVVLATGYRERSAEGLLAALDGLLERDGSGRPVVDVRQRLVLDRSVEGSVFVQNAERHTHGVGAPDLGLAAWRSAVILDAVTGGGAYRLPSRTAFTSFGPAGGGGGGGRVEGPGVSGVREGEVGMTPLVDD